MIIEPMIVTDKIGRSIVLRNAEEDDAASLIKFMKITTGEPPFLIREPDEFSLTIEQEKIFIKEQKDNPRALMLIATVDEKHIGNCSLNGIDMPIVVKWRLLYIKNIAVQELVN